MRNFVSTVVTMIIFIIGLSFFGSISPAMAQTHRCIEASCAAANWAATAPAVTGPKAPTTQPMACTRVLTYGRTEMVLVAGPRATGPVLYTQRASSGHYTRINHSGEAGSIYIAEFCFPSHLIAGLRAITICNGMVAGEGYHHTLSLGDESAPYMRRLQTTGHVGDFLSLLGERKTYSNPIAGVFTASLYRSMYGG